MEKDEIIQLLKSNDIEDRKLGVILLSKVCRDRTKFRKRIEDLKYEDESKIVVIYYTSDWGMRIYVDINGIWAGKAQNHSLKDSLYEFGTDVERYELDI